MAGIFSHLHVHSHFSFLDGASSPEALAHRAAELGQEALALTDWSGLYAAPAFDHACRAVGVRPVFGAEIALTDGTHLTLLVRDAAGWRGLCRLLTAAQLEGEKGAAPVRPALLAEHTAGLLCLSGCREGLVAAPLLAGDEESARRSARWLQDLFGDHLWIELPRNDLPDDRTLTRALATLADQLGVGIVATANVHYATRDEAPLADVLACIRTGITLDVARGLRLNHCFHLASAEEMVARFADLPQAVTDTAVVAGRCTFALDFGPHRFPSVALPPRRTADEHLQALCRVGLTERYQDGDAALWRRAVRQLAHELAVVAQLGLAAYFLIVHDLVRFARERGIPCQGRGSAAGSVIAYALGIARVEPLGNRLLFERFLSVERASPPDIDIDFSHGGREEVIQYLYARYGAAHTAMACTVQTYGLRGAVRDAGKAFGIPMVFLEALAKQVRQGLDDTLAQAVTTAAGPMALDAPLWRHFVTICEQLVGTPRHLGIHNGGVVVTGPPLGDLVPLERATMPGRVVVQWDKDSLERAGLIKLDVLALQSLDLVKEAVDLAARHEGRAIDLDRLRLDDPAVYDLLCAADTIGTFQVESRAQQQSLPQHQPRGFDDLVRQISIIRPGPIQSGQIQPYLRRRAGEEPVAYAHPLLEPVLASTLGILLFQEQVLEVATVLAGFTPGEGDELRRAMGAHRSRRKMAALEERFLAGAATKGIAATVADEVFRQITAFAGYGFPRAHAVAFARLAYETAWLKAHHPVAFYTARLNAQPGGFYPPSVIIGDARRHGVAVRGPDLARSAYDCTIEDGTVRLGLRYVRGLAETTGRALVAERERRSPFRDLADLCRRGRAFLAPEMIATLVASGACDRWNQPRRRLLWQLPGAWRGAVGLAFPVSVVDLPPEDTLDRVAGETWATGIPLSAHPVATQRSALEARGVLPLAALADASAGRAVTVAGRLVVLQRPPTAHGVTFVTLEDETGLGNLVLSPAVDRRCRAALHATAVLVAAGTVQRRGLTVNVQVTGVMPWQPM